MYNEEQMYVALRKFNWVSVLSLLPNQDQGTLKKLLTDVLRSGCFLRLHALKPTQEQKRRAMKSDLRIFAVKVGGKTATGTVIQGFLTLS